MDNAGYVSLSRQAGLLRELDAVANNIANISTNGFRREGSIFAEHYMALDDGDPGLSVATMSHRFLDLAPGDITQTDNPLDMAIEGQGFFLLETQNGQRLTRDGAFTRNAEGELTAQDGARVLDDSGGAILIPAQAKTVTVGDDGSVYVDNQVVAKVGVVTADPAYLIREGNNRFRAEAEITPVENARVSQNALESSNVSAVTELARLIDVQRTYELSKSLSDSENDRIEQTVQTLGRS